MEDASHFKKSRYILMSNPETLRRRNVEAASSKLYRKGSTLFNTDAIPPTSLCSRYAKSSLGILRNSSARKITANRNESKSVAG